MTGASLSVGYYVASVIGISVEKSAEGHVRRLLRASLVA